MSTDHLIETPPAAVGTFLGFSWILLNCKVFPLFCPPRVDSHSASLTPRSDYLFSFPLQIAYSSSSPGNYVVSSNLDRLVTVRLWVAALVIVTSTDRSTGSARRGRSTRNSHHAQPRWCVTSLCPRTNTRCLKQTFLSSLPTKQA